MSPGVDARAVRPYIPNNPENYKNPKNPGKRPFGRQRSHSKFGIMFDKILILDGAMGTMIQRHNLSESDFRGNLPIPPDVRVKGANDLLCLTRPDVIADIHRAYINAGADIIETNSFNANRISMAEYGAGELVASINERAAAIAREAADGAGHRVLVAGSMGPSNVSLSIAEAGAGVDFETMAEAYREQAAALIRGGVDILLLETVFDSLNAKAALAGVRDAIGGCGRAPKLMVSVTLTEQGRTLSGQTLRAFVNSIRHARPNIVGLNCGFGAENLAPYLEELQDLPCMISMHPNAGLPDELGNYTESPEKMAAHLDPWLRRGWLNIIGGCCGTTPDHIRAIAEMVKGSPKRYPARRVPEEERGVMHLSGLEAAEIREGEGFVKVGERCNVAGSRKFLRLINEGASSEALEIAAGQVAKGAGVLDINMDDGMLDAPAEMERFVMLLGGDAATSALPLMVDSSDMEVVRRALRRIQGRPIVNSISLKEGEEKFLAHADEIRRLGGVAVVMAFDENGQATDFARRIEICGRAYRLLTGRGWRGEEIIFDPNILTIATGMREHDRYALDFLDATEWIKSNLPGAKVSGGVSNLSFSFRGIGKLREAMHTVFLHHAILRGMDMAIVNPGESVDISGVADDLRERIEDVIFCRREDATEQLMETAAEMKAEADAAKQKRLAARGQEGAQVPAKAVPVKPASADTLEGLIEKGMDTNLHSLLEEALREEGSAMGVVKNRLMAAMQRVGDEFGAGRMFLPQVVRAASVMKRAIDYLTPVIERESAAGGKSADATPEAGKGERRFVLATVKGDVHDIGKNIVAVVLRCSGFEVTDLGVMVEPDRIISTLKESGARFLGVSGLITPSLSEMGNVARRLEEEGLGDVVLCVGGAATSALHTAVRIAPLFSGLTLHTRDAAALPVLAARLADDSGETAALCAREIRNEQERIRKDYEERKNVPACPCCGAPAPNVPEREPAPAPLHAGLAELEIKVGDVRDRINRKALLHAWQITPAMTRSVAAPESERLLADAERMLDAMEGAGMTLRARGAILPARREGLDILVSYRNAAGEEAELRLPTLRGGAADGDRPAMADFVAPEGDWLGMFCVTTSPFEGYGKILAPEGDEYSLLLLQSLADRLVEAATDYFHDYIHAERWGLKGERGIRPAVGYPSLPDQTLVFELDRILDYGSLGVSLTENGALSPSATTTGLIFGRDDARYFEVGGITEEEIEDYARRRGVGVDRIRAILGGRV